LGVGAVGVAARVDTPGSRSGSRPSRARKPSESTLPLGAPDPPSLGAQKYSQTSPHNTIQTSPSTQRGWTALTLPFPPTDTAAPAAERGLHGVLPRGVGRESADADGRDKQSLPGTSTTRILRVRERACGGGGGGSVTAHGGRGSGTGGARAGRGAGGADRGGAAAAGGDHRILN